MNSPLSNNSRPDTTWFTEARLGLFVHWGAYSAGARGICGENIEEDWIMKQEIIPEEKYRMYFETFDPDLYDPREWAQAAWDAGMRYLVVGTKHHEGFCLWDTRYTDYKATNTPARRDLLKPMMEAFRARGFRVGLYYSLLDWHHPDFTIDYLHPRRFDPDAVAKNTQRNMERYREYMRNQVRELLTQYGRIDILWMDFCYPGSDPHFPHFKGKGAEDWGSEQLHTLIRELQPQILLNDRMGVEDGWDIMSRHTERNTPQDCLCLNGKPAVWETCQTMSGAWGYHRDESTWQSAQQMIGLLSDVVSKGGNLLMNVGPTARGEFDYRAREALANYAEWMKRHERSIRGCTQAPPELTAPRDCRLTFNPKLNRAYLHILNWPPKVHNNQSRIHLHGWGGKVRYAQLLNDASEVRFGETDKTPQRPLDPTGQEIPGAINLPTGLVVPNSVILNLPVVKPNVTVPVVELFLR